MRLPLLDGLRTIAAIGVMLYHISAAFGPTRLFTRTYLFVDLFFLLSGFVLTLAAEAGMAKRPALDFVKLRIRRLWPLVAVGTVAGALHAVLLHRLTDRQLLGLIALSGIALAVAIAVVGGCTMGPNTEYWWLAAPRVVWAYGLGIWCARRWRKTGPRPVLGWQAAILAPLAALLVLPWLPLGQAPGDALAVLVVLPALFWIAANAVVPPAVAPALAGLGAISFPLYALHEPVLVAMSWYSETPTAKFAAAAMALVLAVLVARFVPGLGPAPRRRDKLARHPAPLATT